MRYWDWPTFFLYLIVGSSVVFISWFSENVGVTKVSTTKKKYNALGLMSYFYLFLFLVFIAAFRFIGNTIGGADALVYINYFVNPPPININLNNILTFNQTEPMFFFLTGIIRRFTDSQLVFLIIYYGFIVYAYLKFISKNFNKNMSFSPLIYVVLPFLNSFNTMRSAIAMAVTLLAFNHLRDGKHKKAIGIIIIAGLFHYTALIIFIFFLFYKIVSSKIFNKRKWATIFLILIYITFTLGEPIIKNLISSTKYEVYLVQENSLIGQLIIIIIGVLSIVNFNKLKKRLEGNDILLWAVIFNFMMIPLMVNFGFFRLNSYFVFPRLFIWSHTIEIIKENFKYNIHFYRIIEYTAFVCSLSWTIFRITQDWYPEGVMPYFNILFK